MKNEKKIIIIAGLVLLSLYAFYMGKYFLANRNISPADKKVQIKNDFFPFTYTFQELDFRKITLSDTQASVIKILGEPKTIAKTQRMFPIDLVDIYSNCQFLLYDNFFIIMREGKVSGWYFNLENISSKNNLIYLPGVKTQEEGNFLDFYKGWEVVSSQNYTEAFSNFEKYNLGKIYFCAVWGDTTSGNGEMVIYSYNEKYKLKQRYMFDSKKLILKVVGTIDLTLVKSGESYNSMFLGRNVTYIKKYFSDAVLKNEREDIGIEGKKVHVVAFEKKNVMYRLDFNEQGACVNVSLSYE